ncbi:MAG: ABC transporter ATP-binding protein, partial [Chlorobi bacterium]|nr:ABC transporter ATP-binding protein [Chlorobiota bacterium]
MIQIRNLVKKYIRGKNIVAALQDVSCNIRKGEIFSVIGKSGSGKSTLLNLIGGLDRPTSGHIFFNGKDLMEMNRQELAEHRKKNVGMIFQSINLIYSRTALENIMLALAFGGVSRHRRKVRAGELLEMVGLSGRMDHKPDELSGGEAQRVAIARALANNPSAILADEPTGNLD